MYYDQLKRRIRLLRERKAGKVYVTLLYDDGTEKTVGGLEAVEEIITDHSIVDVKCHDEAGQSLFSALFQAELESGDNFDSIDELTEGEESG